jgi:hypothetical protein
VITKIIGIQQISFYTDEKENFTKKKKKEKTNHLVKKILNTAI